MATLAESPRRSPFPVDPRGYSTGTPKALPILSTSITLPSINAIDQMDLSQPHSGAMGPPSQQSPRVNGDRAQEQLAPAPNEHHPASGSNAHPAAAAAAAAAAQQPKVVQTAFIHKLYKFVHPEVHAEMPTDIVSSMLEDPSIQHLISWSSTNESFVMSPSSEFSKVLASTCTAFTKVRILLAVWRRYGGTDPSPVSDVFHTGSPDSPLWEFKHGAGNFKRGDLVGLREIKRRASRHALIHRDSFSSATSKAPLPPPPGPPMESMPDPLENRLGLLEWNSQDLHSRLARTEEAYTAMANKCQALLDGISRCHMWNEQLSSHLLTLVPDPENPLHRDVYAMRQEISSRMENLQSLGEPPHDAAFGSKHSYFQSNGNFLPDSTLPMSPRQRPFDDSRRPSLQGIHSGGRPNVIRAAVPQHLQTSPRRYGSIGGPATYSPTVSRTTATNPLPPAPKFQQAQPPPPPPPSQQPHPLSNTSPSPGPVRRHTSADIRVPGWQGGQPSNHYPQGSSPYASGESSTAWPSSPRTHMNAGDQQIQETLAQYELPRMTHNSSHRPSSPGPHETGIPSFANNFGSGSGYVNTNDAGWQLPGPRFPFKGLETPGPPTRRSSMASNVHSLLNPADTAERDNEDDGTAPDDRKRKRIQ
nr:transcription factor sfl2 [Quercus suber]